MGFGLLATDALSRGMRVQRTAEGSPRGGYDHRAFPIREIRANPWPFSFVIPEIIYVKKRWTHYTSFCRETLSEQEMRPEGPGVRSPGREAGVRCTVHREP